MDNNNDDDKNRFMKLLGSNRYALFFLVGLALLFLFFFSFSQKTGYRVIPYSLFVQYVDTGQIDEVEILDQREIQGVLLDRSSGLVGFRTVIPYYDDGLMVLLREKGVKVTGGAKGPSLGMILFQILPWLVSFGFLWWMFRHVQGGGVGKAFSFGRSKAKRYDENKEKITFANVAGQDESKLELMEVVEFLKSPGRFISIGAKIPKGVLLVGSPGTGKTLLAKAVAGEAEVPFFHMSGSDFVEMFVGVGASRVRDLFEQGRKNAPCILFIDEIDAVGRTRGAGYGGGHDEREQTLNQLLVEMDGFDTEQGVIIIAATNRADVLDPALLRPGRFDRQVVVDMPDVREREAILKIHTKIITMDKDVNLLTIAKATPGSSGADLANICNEAALFAGRSRRRKVMMADFEEARDKILMGVARKSRVLGEKERLMTAYHEAGHALLHYYQEEADPIHKVTIIPRGQALGVTFSLPDQDRYSRGSGWLKARLAIFYGGYAAEEIIYKETTTGAQNDIRQATDLARHMVCDWGMSPLGPIALGGRDEPIFIGKEIAQHKDYSESTAGSIDKEIRSLLDGALALAGKILTENKEKLDVLAQALLQEETMEDQGIRELLGLDPPPVPEVP